MKKSPTSPPSVRTTALAVDAGYKTPPIAKFLMDRNVRPVMPYTRPKTKEGYFKKYDYVYDEQYDRYICPQGEAMPYRTTNREGYRQFASDPLNCQKCPVISQCTKSKDHRKWINRHVWEEFLEEAEHLRHTDLPSLP